MVNQESKRPAEKIKSRLNQVVFLNQTLRDHLSRRIEEAYQLRLPDRGRQVFLKHPRVWECRR